jgi:hypothetical protein
MLHKGFMIRATIEIFQSIRIGRLLSPWETTLGWLDEARMRRPASNRPRGFDPNYAILRIRNIMSTRP